MDESTYPAHRGHLLSEAWQSTKDGSAAGASKAWSFTRAHPVPATMIGVGLGWLLVDRIRGVEVGDGRILSGAYSDDYEADFRPGVSEEITSGRIASAAGAVKDAAGHAVESVKEAASTARDKVSEVAGTVKERTSGVSSQVRQQATRIANSTKHQTRRARLGFWQMMEDNPLAVGAAALTLGLLAGCAIPSTDKEDELLGETRDQFLGTVREAGHEALEKGKHIAETAVDTARREAEAQGLTPEGLADKVKAVGREAKNAVADEVWSQDLPGSPAWPEPSGPGMA